MVALVARARHLVPPKLAQVELVLKFHGFQPQLEQHLVLELQVLRPALLQAAVEVEPIGTQSLVEMLELAAVGQVPQVQQLHLLVLQTPAAVEAVQVLVAVVPLKVAMVELESLFLDT